MASNLLVIDRVLALSDQWLLGRLYERKSYAARASRRLGVLRALRTMLRRNAASLLVNIKYLFGSRCVERLDLLAPRRGEGTRVVLWADRQTARQAGNR